MKALELSKRHGVIDTFLIRHLAKISVRQSKSQFRLYDGRGSDIWKDYITNGENYKKGR